MNFIIRYLEWFIAAPLSIGILLTLNAITSPHESADYTNPTVKVQLEQGHGSAVHIGNGYFITAAHVVKDNDTVSLIGNTGLINEEAQVLWANSVYDVALISSYAPNVGAVNLECRTPEVGEKVTLKGNPLNLNNITTLGQIAGLPMSVKGMWKNAVPVDAALGPGMSGGGLFDEDGDLVGINVGAPLAPFGMGASFIGLGYSVPGSTICHLFGRKY